MRAQSLDMTLVAGIGTPSSPWAEARRAVLVELMECQGPVVVEPGAWGVFVMPGSAVVPLSAFAG